MNVRFEGNNGRDVDVTRCLPMTQGRHGDSLPLLTSRGMPDSALHHFLEAGFYGLYRYVGIMACEIRTSPSAIAFQRLKH